MQTIEITDLEHLQQILSNEAWRNDRKLARAVWDYVRSKRIEHLAPVEAPSSRDGVISCTVSDDEVAALTARVRATSGRGGRFFGHWEPPKPGGNAAPALAAPARMSQPPLPLLWFSPAMASWLTEVVTNALRNRAGTWASILHLPDHMSAEELGETVARRVPELEIAVRDTAIWARWNEARV